MNNIVSAATCKCTLDRYLSLDSEGMRGMRKRSLFHQPAEVYPAPALSSWLRWIKRFWFFSLLSTALVWKNPLARNGVKLSIAARRRLWSQTNKKTKSGGWPVKRGRLSEAFFHSWKTARSSEKGFSSKQTPVTLPILLPIKIYWKHPGNTARLISSQLACQKQTNTVITRTRKESFPGLLSS